MRDPIHPHKYEDKGQTTSCLNNALLKRIWRMFVGPVARLCTDMYPVNGRVLYFPIY